MIEIHWFKVSPKKEKKKHEIIRRKVKKGTDLHSKFRFNTKKNWNFLLFSPQFILIFVNLLLFIFLLPSFLLYFFFTSPLTLIVYFLNNLIDMKKFKFFSLLQKKKKWKKKKNSIKYRIFIERYRIDWQNKNVQL